MTITPHPTKAPKTKRAAALRKAAAKRAATKHRQQPATAPTPPADLRASIIMELSQTTAAMSELIDYACYLTNVLTGRAEIYDAANIIMELSQTTAAMSELIDYACYLTNVLTGRAEIYDADQAPYKPAPVWARTPAPLIIGAEDPGKTTPTAAAAQPPILPTGQEPATP